MARERRKIINQLQEKQEKHILAMKKDLLDEIKRGIIDYKVIYYNYKLEHKKNYA